MSDKEQIEMMRISILNKSDDDSQDKMFRIMLSNAENVALNTLYPFDREIQELPKDDKRLKLWQVRCAVELYKKIGSTNIQSYSENGLSVTYMTGLLTTKLMNELVPKAGAIK